MPAAWSTSRGTCPWTFLLHLKKTSFFCLSLNLEGSYGKEGFFYNVMLWGRMGAIWDSLWCVLENLWIKNLMIRKSLNLWFAYYRVFWGLIMTKAVRLLKGWGQRHLCLSVTCGTESCCWYKAPVRASLLFGARLLERRRKEQHSVKSKMPHFQFSARHTLSVLISIWIFSGLACSRSKLKEVERSVNFSMF